MSQDELEKMLRSGLDDEAFRETLRGVGSDAELADLAAARGFKVTLEDIEAFRSELSEDELARVAGGGPSVYNHTGFVTILPYIEQENLHERKS